MATDLVSQGLSCDTYEHLIFDQYKSSQLFIQSVMSDSNKLGEGSRATVYRIPRQADYVVHIWHDIDHEALNTESAIIPLSDCLPGHNIGQPVASLYGGQVQLLRFQPGNNSGIPFRCFFAKYGIDELLGFDLSMRAEDLLPYRERYIKHLRVISRFPQRAYDQLALRIIQIQRNGLFLDPCALNLLVDTDTNTFGTVDHQESIGPYENLLGMVCLLMDTMFVHMDEHAIYSADLLTRISLAACPDLVRIRRRILQKSLYAAMKVGLQWPSEVCPKNVFGFHQSSFDLRYVFRIAGMADRYSEFAAIFADYAGTSVSHISTSLAA